jgi:hypothetical protein
MFPLTEAKAQGWRALALLSDSSERLLYLGRSTDQVRAGYGAAFAEILDDRDRARVCNISLQSWHGAPDRGGWVPRAALPVPHAVGAPRPA